MTQEHGVTARQVEPLFDAAELARQVGFPNADAVYVARSRGADLPAPVVIGRRLRWRQSTVDAWIASREEATREAG